MSKKSKRMKARQVPNRPSGNAQVAMARPVAAEAKVNPRSTQRAASSSYESQYTYIVPELTRIGIVAGIFFVILIVLSFVLN